MTWFEVLLVVGWTTGILPAIVVGTVIYDRLRALEPSGTRTDTTGVWEGFGVGLITSLFGPIVIPIVVVWALFRGVIGGVRVLKVLVGERRPRAAMLDVDRRGSYRGEES
jgi:hypothetical protein